MDSSIPEFEFDASKSVKADEITWHRSRPSYDPMKRTLSYDELCTLTECEGVVETLTLTETAVWICDEIRHRLELQTTLHACMDALNTTLKTNSQLKAAVQRLTAKVRERASSVAA